MKLKVLIVEDEGLVAMLMEDMLIELGHEVIGSAGMLAEANALVDAPFDLAILDVNLGGVRTFDLARNIRKKGRALILATGYGASGIADDLQTVTMLQKPFEETGLAAAIQNALQKQPLTQAGDV